MAEEQTEKEIAHIEYFWETLFDLAGMDSTVPQMSSPEQDQTNVHNETVQKNGIEKQGRALSCFNTYYLESTTESRDIPGILAEIRQVEEGYLETLKNNRSDYGIYAQGRYDNDTLNSEEKYSLKLEWRLFNDGYFEAVREDEKKILQTRLEFFQMQRDMVQRALDEKLYQLSKTENLVNFHHAQEKLKYLKKLTRKRRNQLTHGYTTRFDLLNIERKLNEAKRGVEFFSQLERSGLPSEVMAVLNRVERLRIHTKEALLKPAQDHSLDLKIQDTFISRSKFFPGWTDNLAVNINGGYQREFFGLERSMVGIELEVPLTFDWDKNDLIHTQQRIYKLQKEAVKRRLEQKLERLRTMFIFQQKLLHDRQASLATLLEELHLNEKRRAHPIQLTDDDPDRVRDNLIMELIDKKYDCLRIRLKLYGNILTLLATTKVDNVTDLFQFPEESGSPDHSVEPSGRHVE